MPLLMSEKLKANAVLLTIDKTEQNDYRRGEILGGDVIYREKTIQKAFFVCLHIN